MVRLDRPSDRGLSWACRRAPFCRVLPHSAALQIRRISLTTIRISIYSDSCSRSHNTEVDVCNLLKHKHLQMTAGFPTRRSLLASYLRAFAEHVRCTGTPRQAQTRPGARRESRRHCQASTYDGPTSVYFIRRSCWCLHVPARSQEPKRGDVLADSPLSNCPLEVLLNLVHCRAARPTQLLLRRPLQLTLSRAHICGSSTCRATDHG